MSQILHRNNADGQSKAIEIVLYRLPYYLKSKWNYTSYKKILNLSYCLDENLPKLYCLTNDSIISHKFQTLLSDKLSAQTQRTQQEFKIFLKIVSHCICCLVTWWKKLQKEKKKKKYKTSLGKVLRMSENNWGNK